MAEIKNQGRSVVTSGTPSRVKADGLKAGQEYYLHQSDLGSGTLYWAISDSPEQPYFVDGQFTYETPDFMSKSED